MAAADHQNIKFHYRSNNLLMMRVNSLSVLRAKINGEDLILENLISADLKIMHQALFPSICISKDPKVIL